MIKVLQTILCLLSAGILACAGRNLKTDPNVNLSAPPPANPAVPTVFARCDTIPCSCSCDDPFDPRTIPLAGDFAGMCLNTCEQRSVQRLSQRQAAAGEYFKDSCDDSNVVFAANVADFDAHGDLCFYVARIPLSSITTIIMQIEHAGGIQAHAQLRIVFSRDNPVNIVSQRKNVPREEKKTTDITFSVEALAPPGVPYKGDYGFRSHYFQAYRLTTLAVRARKMIKQDHHHVWQYQLALSGHDKAAIMDGLIGLGTKWAHSNHYHTTKNNCVLELFRVIDSRATIPWFRRLYASLWNNTLFLPTKAPSHLKHRGLNPRNRDDFRLPNLEVELGWQGDVNEDLCGK
jgi:hypothetical protein